MLIDKFVLASRDSELDYLFAGGATIDSVNDGQNILPFGVFPKLHLESVPFYDVTLFFGSRDSVSNLLLSVISYKLGEQTSFPKMRCIKDYCRLSNFKYSSYESRDFDVRVISRTQGDECVRSGKSLIKLYEKKIDRTALYILQLPEHYMSIEEQYALMGLIDDAVRYYDAQFIISTNSPILLGIKNALIYDFDKIPVVPHTWSNSPLVKRLTRMSQEIASIHKRIK